MSDESNRNNLTDDQIAQMNMSGWLNQMASIWHIHQHVFVAEGAALTAWYFLHSKDETLMASALLLIVNVLFYIAIFIVKRTYQITSGMHRTLQDLGVFRNKPAKPSLIIHIPQFRKKIPKLNHQIARLLILIIIAINLALSIASIFSHMPTPSIENISSIRSLLSIFSISPYYPILLSAINVAIFISLIWRWNELFLDEPNSL